MHMDDIKNWIALFLFYSSLAMIMAIAFGLAGCSPARFGL